MWGRREPEGRWNLKPARAQWSVSVQVFVCQPADLGGISCHTSPKGHSLLVTKLRWRMFLPSSPQVFSIPTGMDDVKITLLSFQRWNKRVLASPLQIAAGLATLLSQVRHHWIVLSKAVLGFQMLQDKDASSNNQKVWNTIFHLEPCYMSGLNL